MIWFTKSGSFPTPGLVSPYRTSKSMPNLCAPLCVALMAQPKPHLALGEPLLRPGLSENLGGSTISLAQKTNHLAEVISPAACGALFSACTTHFAALASWNPGGTLVEPWWNPGGTLVEPYLRAAPDHPKEPIWAETPRLSAVGEKQKNEDCLGPTRVKSWVKVEAPSF